MSDLTFHEVGEMLVGAYRKLEPGGEVTGQRVVDFFIDEAHAAADMRTDLDARRGRTDGLYQAVRFLHGETVDPAKVTEAAEVFRHYLEGGTDA